MRYRVGVDLGGTSAKIGLVDSRKKIVRETAVATLGFPNPALLVKKISEETFDLLGPHAPVRVGIGVAGDIDSANGVVRVSPNLGWKKVPLKKYFKKYFKCEVVVENDANAAAWGIYQTQIPSSIKNVVVMTLGTGVGGGIVLDGKLWRGVTGSAGEIGHLNIDVKGPLCNCGNRGCLETYVGGPHLIKKVRAAIKRGVRTSLNSESVTPYLIHQAAKRGDVYAKSIWRDVGQALGLAIGDLVYLLNPEMIVFTGGIAQAGDFILKPLWKTLRGRAFKTPINAVQIKVAEEAAHIGVLGAALL